MSARFGAKVLPVLKGRLRCSAPQEKFCTTCYDQLWRDGAAHDALQPRHPVCTQPL